MVVYSQQTSLNGGRFAPNVQYNASVRMPTQPMPELKEPDSKFNIDLSGLGRAMLTAKATEARVEMFKAEQERLAEKERAAAEEKERYDNLKRSFALEMSGIQSGVDQDAYDSVKAERLMRQSQDKYLALGLDPSDMYSISDKGISSDIRGVHSDRRKKIQDTVNEADAEIYKNTINNVPSMANKDPEQVIAWSRRADQIADDLSAMIIYGQESGNKQITSYIDDKAGEMAAIQRDSVVLNKIANGDLTSDTAALEIYTNVNSTLLSVGVPADMAKDKAERQVAKIKPILDMAQKANESELKRITDNLNMTLTSTKAATFNNSDTKGRVKMALGLWQPGDELAIDTDYKYTYETTVNASMGADGKVTYTPRKVATSVTDFYGNTVQVQDGNVEQAIKELNRASQMSLPIAHHFNVENATSVMGSPMVSLQGKNISTLSTNDVNNLIANRDGALKAIRSDGVMKTAENVGDTSFITGVNKKTSAKLGFEYYAGNREFVDSLNLDKNVRALTSQPMLLEHTRLTDEGMLITAPDVPGFLGSLAQYSNGAAFKREIQEFNKGISQLPPTQGKNVSEMMLESAGIYVKNYDPEVDGVMSSETTKGEAVAENVQETLGVVWDKVYKEASKYYQKLEDWMTENVAKPIYDEVTYENTKTVINDIKGGTFLKDDAKKLIDKIKQGGKDYIDYVVTLKTLYQAGAGGEGLSSKISQPVSEDVLVDFLDTIRNHSNVEYPEVENSINNIIQTEPIIPPTADPLDFETYPLNKNSDGSVSNIKTEIIGREVDGQEVEFIVPTMGDTTKHFGGYATKSDAEAADKKIHERLNEIVPQDLDSFVKDSKDKIDSLVEEGKVLWEGFTDELAVAAEPVAGFVKNFKAGRQSGIFTFSDTDKAYDTWAQVFNEEGKKPFGLIRQILLTVPFSLGFATGQSEKSVPIVAGAIYELLEESGIEVSRANTEKLAKTAVELYGETYRRNVKQGLMQRKKNAAEFRKFSKGGTAFQKTYYGVKEKDEENRALMEPFLYD